MAYEQRKNSGSLFKNDKQGNESRPDYTGDIDIEGTLYRLSAWIKDGKSGKFMSLSAQPKEVSAAKKIAAVADEFIDDDVPF